MLKELIVVAAVCTGPSSILPTASFEGARMGLQHALEVEEVQSGFAGDVGRVWVVDRSGRWELRGIIDGAVAGIEASGDLTPEALAAIGEALATADLDVLPAELGEPAPVNPGRITIRYGDHVISLRLAPGRLSMEGGSDPSAAESDEAAAVLTIAKEVREQTTDR